METRMTQCKHLVIRSLNCEEHGWECEQLICTNCGNDIQEKDNQ